MTDYEAVLVLSGGLDSTTLLYQLNAWGYKVHAVTFDYGQRHRREIECAIINAREARARHHIVDLSKVAGVWSESALLGSGPVPLARYGRENMKKTVVPNRNMVMLSISAAYAIKHKIQNLFIGIHAGDHDIYPDCLPDFYQNLRKALMICDYDPVDLRAPFLNTPKHEIVKKGLALGVDYSNTWTCYEGEELPCGECGSCRERLQAFELNGAKDPLEYRK